MTPNTRLTQSSSTREPRIYTRQMDRVRRISGNWLPISIAPNACDLEVCVIDNESIHYLMFPCRKSGKKWFNALTNIQIEVLPTHWRIWRRDSRPRKWDIDNEK